MPIQTEADIPDLSGKIALVTGATGGLGWETARMLAQAGAHVIVSGRNAEKGAEAIRRIAALKPRGGVEFESLDLADQAAIAAAAARIAATHERLDILVNNAGVMALPKRQTTKDGFETQFGTNHLGHFALTGRLLPLLQRGKARVVTVSSMASLGGKMGFDDLQAEGKYSPWGAYGQSKLANLLFMRGLQQRSARGGWGIESLAAHPGASNTDLFSNGPASAGGFGKVAGWFGHWFGQSAAAGALPSVAAAVDRSVPAGSYVGPDRLGGWRGKPKVVQPPRSALDDEDVERLWAASENLTEVRYDGVSRT